MHRFVDPRCCLLQVHGSKLQFAFLIFFLAEGVSGGETSSANSTEDLGNPVALKPIVEDVQLEHALRSWPANGMSQDSWERSSFEAAKLNKE